MNSLLAGHRITNRFLTPIWLVLLYPVLIWSVVGSLSSQGFQEKVRHRIDSKSISEVFLEVDRLEEAKAQQQRLLLQLKELEKRDRQLQKELEAPTDQIRVVQTKREVQLEQLQQKIDLTTDELKTILQKINSDFKQYLEALQFTEQHKKMIIDEWQIYQHQNQELLTLEEEKEIILTKIRANLSNRDSVKSELNAVRQSVEVFYNKGLGGILNELDYLKTFRFYLFSTMPSQLLTLILMLSMGTLGSLIYITQVYFSDDPDKPFSWYLFRPFLGMVTAIAIFVLAKAGQITIATSSVTETISENLNPFFISFLAIISGLLSEQATERIRHTGSAFFRTDTASENNDTTTAQLGAAPNALPGAQRDGAQATEPTPPLVNGTSPQSALWAVNLEEIMKTQGKTAAELTTFVEAPLAVVEDWITRKRPIPHDAQRIIASWVGMPRHDLFTDLAPMPDGSREPSQSTP